MKKTDDGVGEIRAIRRAMTSEAGGDIARYVDMVRAVEKELPEQLRVPPPPQEKRKAG